MREFGLIGRTLSHSFSAEFFTEKFRREGLTECCYRLFELRKIEELPHFLEHHPDLVGFNVTIPYKQQIIPYLDRLDDAAERIGAVNCVKREGAQWVGYNTDVVGFERALSAAMQGPVERALVLGTGGASAAVQYLLSKWEIPFDILSRDPQKGNYTYQNLPVELLQEAKLIVNATPIGTYPDTEQAPTLPYAFLTPDHLLFDLVYNPPKSQFLVYGEQRGARIENGYRMLVEQAEAAWEIWNR